MGWIPWSLPRGPPSPDLTWVLPSYLAQPRLCKWTELLPNPSRPVSPSANGSPISLGTASRGCRESPRGQGRRAAGRQGGLVVGAGARGPSFTLLTPAMEDQDLQDSWEARPNAQALLKVILGRIPGRRSPPGSSRVHTGWVAREVMGG